jgi:hypothetical protein
MLYSQKAQSGDHQSNVILAPSGSLRRQDWSEQFGVNARFPRLWESLEALVKGSGASGSNSVRFMSLEPYGCKVQDPLPVAV